MSLRIFLTVLHDLIIFIFSFFLALLLRLELQPALDLFSMLWVYSVGFSIMNIITKLIFYSFRDVLRRLPGHDLGHKLRIFTTEIV